MTDEPKRQLSPAERIFVRISLLQTVLAVIGIFTGAVALYAALNEADAVRKQLDASVWPNIEPGTDRWSKEAVARRSEFAGVEGPMFRFTVLNSGIGPAKIQSVRIRVDGVAHRNWNSLLTALTGEEPGEEGFEFGTSTIGGRVIPAGNQVNPLTLIGERAEKVIAALPGREGTQRVTLEICYCSVYDRCWVTEDDPSTADSEPAPVKKCPDYGDEAFLE
jgi:hypothetical protein